MRTPLPVFNLVSSILILGTLVSCGGSDSNNVAAPGSLGSIKVLSNRADLVSGDDALVEIVPAGSIDFSNVKVQMDGRDVTNAFAVRDGRYVGLVSGMQVGKNVLTASAVDGRVASATITNQRNGGAVIYAPQAKPWTCDPGAADQLCNRPTSFTYLYKSTDPAKVDLLPYNPASPPQDIATTVTEAGISVPFIVRLETGVIDRDYYNIAVLFDPAKTWQPWNPQSTWNKKVVYKHGAGAGLSFKQLNAITSANVRDTYALSKGFVVASTALNDTGHNANIAVQAEAMMMLREHIIEAYGEIKYAIGSGGSGGAIAQQWVANAYPGLYNGLIVDHSFPDVGTTAVEIEDCSLLYRYFKDIASWDAGVAWTDADKFAASGHSGNVCKLWVDRGQALGLGVDFGYPQLFDPKHQGVINFPGISPTAIGGCDLALSDIYDPISRRNGVRCTLQDYVVGILGKRATDGFANRPYGNIGVQYGLSALTAGKITPAQFIDLNSKIGSHDIDAVFQPSRVAADALGVEAAYRSGFVNTAANLNQVAILDVRDPDIDSHHHQYRSWVMRDRLERVQGHHKNQVIWYNSTKSSNDALSEMDKWLSAVFQDNSNQPVAAKIAANRPVTLVDLCKDQDGTNLTMAQCTGGVLDSSPRIAAGMSFADDILDCKLVALDRSKYGVIFTDAQWTKLQAAFPAGVCDYSSPSKGQQPTLPWLRYTNAAGDVIYGGAPLPSLQ